MRLLSFHVLLIPLFFISCKKDSAIPNKPKTVCGTEGWPQGNWKIKFVVNGLVKPDSINFNINDGQTQFGTFYYKTFIQPSLILMDSTNFCGDKNSDIIIKVYNQDTTKTFTTTIFLNDSLIIQKTGYGYIFTVGQCK